MVLAGCTLGPGTYTRAKDPAGVMISIEMEGRNFGGELLAADEEALVLLTGNRRILRVPFSGISRLDVSQFEDLDLRDGQPPAGGRLTRLQRLSRFPQGMTPEIEVAVLAAYDQESFEVP